MSQPVVPLIRLDGDPGAVCDGDDCFPAAVDPTREGDPGDHD